LRIQDDYQAALDLDSQRAGCSLPNWTTLLYNGISAVTVICHKPWGSRPEATSLPPSVPFFLPSHGLPRGSGQSPLTHCQRFWCNLRSQSAL